MSAVFTQQAIDRMQERKVDRTDVDRLISLIDRVGETSGGLDRSPDVAVIRRNSDGAMYIARAGSLRAVLITGTSEDSVVVANVYRRDEEEIGGFLSGPREAPTPARAV